MKRVYGPNFRFVASFLQLLWPSEDFQVLQISLLDISGGIGYSSRNRLYFLNEWSNGTETWPEYVNRVQTTKWSRKKVIRIKKIGGG